MTAFNEKGYHLFVTCTGLVFKIRATINYSCMSHRIRGAKWRKPNWSECFKLEFTINTFLIKQTKEIQKSHEQRQVKFWVLWIFLISELSSRFKKKKKFSLPIKEFSDFMMLFNFFLLKLNFSILVIHIFFVKKIQRLQEDFFKF